MVKKIVKNFLKKLYFSYPGYLLFNFSKRLTGYKEEKQNFFKKLGYYPNLQNPKSFNEKILWRKMYDRNPAFPIILDKYKVRQYIKDVLGKFEAEKILIPLIYVTDKPDTIPFYNLPEEYIIKPNHGSGWFILVGKKGGKKTYTVSNKHKNTVLDFSNESHANKYIIKTCKNWLNQSYNFYQYEWAYQKIKRKIIIEKLLVDKTGKIPADFKCHIFDGKCYMIQVIDERFSELKNYVYSPEWIPIIFKNATKKSKKIKKPESLKKLINLAEKLGVPFDFIRIDLYLLGKKLYFGEFTLYPFSGKSKFSSTDTDFEIGAQWQIKSQ